MVRLSWLAGALGLALLLAVWSVQTPRPADVEAPAGAFSAARALDDVRQIAQRPHPVGSADHARVEAYLTQRMAALGLSPEVHTGPLSEGSVRRLARWDILVGPEVEARNLVGVLPGLDRGEKPVLLMAHYDSVAGSPGAADDAAGVAAILETVRALKARGPLRRDVVVLITDAEELGLDGARAFFGGHPLRDRIGAVVNLEARGGGGRAMMFETGQGNAETVALFADIAGRVDGGVTSNSLAVFVYDLMPNDTDFTLPRDRGLRGLNFAFIGRPAQYHADTSTVAGLDAGSLQHVGSQALESIQALGDSQTLPRRRQDAVYADVFGRVVLHHAPATGWLILALALVAAGVAAWRVRPDPGDVGRGALDGLWFLSTGLVLTHLVRLLAGPMSSRLSSSADYYALLRRLPWIEAGAALAVLSVALFVLAGREPMDGRRRRMVAAVVAVVTLAALALTGFNAVTLGALVLSVGLSWPPDLAPRTSWGASLGLIALVALIGAGAQVAAPQTAFLFLWPAALAAVAALVAAVLDPSFASLKGRAAPAVALALGGGWLFGLVHPVFLGIGMDLPGVVAALGLMCLMLARPLADPSGPGRRVLMIAAAVALALGVAASAGGRLAEPASPPDATDPG